MSKYLEALEHYKNHMKEYHKDNDLTDDEALNVNWFSRVIVEALQMAHDMQSKTIKDVVLDGRTYLVLDEDGEIFSQFFEYPNDLEHYEDCAFYEIAALPTPQKGNDGETQ